MRKTIIVLSLLGVATIMQFADARAQQRKMRVHLKDGTIQSYADDSISNIAFTKISYPKYTVMYAYTGYIIPSPDRTALSEFDSMGFLRDSAYGDLLVLYPRRNPP